MRLRLACQAMWKRCRKPFNPTVVRLRLEQRVQDFLKNVRLSIPLWCDCDTISAINTTSVFSRLRFSPSPFLFVSVSLRPRFSPSPFLPVSRSSPFQSHCGAITLLRFPILRFSASPFPRFSASPFPRFSASPFPRFSVSPTLRLFLSISPRCDHDHVVL